MYKILIVYTFETGNSTGGAAVSTEIVSFDSKEEAEDALSAVQVKVIPEGASRHQYGSLYVRRLYRL